MIDPQDIMDEEEAEAYQAVIDAAREARIERADRTRDHRKDEPDIPPPRGPIT